VRKVDHRREFEHVFGYPVGGPSTVERDQSSSMSLVHL